MQQILVTAAIIIENDLILMAQRSDGEEAGKWEFPGGKVEFAEDPRICLQRELREELGIEASVGRILEVVSQSKNGRQLVLLYFKCSVRKGNPQPLQCSQFKWCRPEEIDLLEKPPADQAFWKEYRQAFNL